MQQKIEIGMQFTNKFGTCVVTQYINANQVKIKWVDDYEHEMYVQSDSLRRGAIKNPFFPSILGVAFVGIGPHVTAINSKSTKPYYIWKALLTRCYDPKKRSDWPSYEDCTVCKDWLNFQNFAQWYTDNYVEDWCLDKDILIRGNKLYSPLTCCFVPPAINSLFTRANSIRGDYLIGVHKPKKRPNLFVASCNDGTGKSAYLGCYKTEKDAHLAYKIFKEALIKQIAEEYKNELTLETYTALMGYQVNEDD